MIVLKVCFVFLFVFLLRPHLEGSSNVSEGSVSVRPGRRFQAVLRPQPKSTHHEQLDVLANGPEEFSS